MQIVRGLNHIHQEGIAHRDIKPDNILISTEDNSLKVKIIDFGFSTAFSKGDLECGTPNFMAPELLEKGKNVYCTKKVDVWALGVLLFYLCEGRYPFKGYDEKDLFKNIKLTEYTLKKTTDEQLIKILEATLQKDPSLRSSIKDILSNSDP